MVRLTKAKRGKHRWVGILVNSKIKNRQELSSILSNLLEDSTWKLYDFVHMKKEDDILSIIKVELKSHKKYIKIINSHDLLETITSSGKIILVRQRLQITRS